MFNFLKRIFSPSTSPKRPSTPVSQPAPAPSSKITRIGDAAPGVEVASLSLKAILDKFPPDLKATINAMPEVGVKVVLPVNAIMKQLAGGAVKMSLGSLHRQAPSGTFRKTNMEEKRMVDVPLGEVFKSINPGRLQRRQDQKHYVVPEEIVGLFGESNGSRSLNNPNAARPAEEASLPPPAAAPAPTPALRMTSAPEPRNGHAAPPAPKPSTARPVAKPTPAPVTPLPMKPAAAAEPETPAVPLKLDGELALSLMELAAHWPEGLRSDLSVLTGETKIVLPVAEVSTGLQKGKVQFTWQQLRSWLQPQPTMPIDLADETMIQLPLKIVAPAFVAATGAKKRLSNKATVNQELPDFFGPGAGRNPAATPAAPPTPAPAAPAAEAPAVPEPVTTPEAEAPAPPAIEPAAPAALVMPAATQPGTSAAEPQNLGELFNQADKTEWTPNEMVNLAAELPGVSGAVVALEEGLVVAHRLPAGLAPETFAAFMPQIFSRLDKYTGEMQLGETSDVTLQTTGGPCQFFRRSKVFFATLGSASGPLPPGLKLIANELARQNA